MAMQLFTIGHSNHSMEKFLSLLARHGIEAVADIRRFPGSRKHPHFGQASLAAVLKDAGIDYRWIEALGGRRKKQGQSANLGLRNESFRKYADYMLTQPFREGIEQLLEIAGQKRTAMLCAEGLFWQCHRRLVSDYLTANRIAVVHIMPNGETRPHSLTTGAVMENGSVMYPGEPSLFAN